MKTEKQKLIDKADKLWSKAVRENYNDRCVKCGGKATASHHIESRIHKNTRWDIPNGVSVCYPCHIHYFHGKPAESMRWLKDFYGDRIKDLEKKSKIIFQPTVKDLEKIIIKLNRNRG